MIQDSKPRTLSPHCEIVNAIQRGQIPEIVITMSDVIFVNQITTGIGSI